MHAHRERSHRQLLRAKVSNAPALCFSNIWLQLLQHMAPTAATRAAAMRHMFAPRFRSAARLSAAATRVCSLSY